MLHVVNMLDKENTNFTRNKNYWQSGKPHLDTLIVNVRKDAQSMVADLESGAADLVYDCTLQDYLRLKNDASVRTCKEHRICLRPRQSEVVA